MPVEWAQTTKNLANAYSDRIRGNRAQNIEAAITAYRTSSHDKNTLRPCQWSGHKPWTIWQPHIRNRSRSDRAQNIEEAIAAYKQALTVMTQAAMPVEWADYHDESGNCLLFSPHTW